MTPTFNRKDPKGAVEYFRYCIQTGDISGTMDCFDTDATYIERDGQSVTGLENIQKSMEHLCVWKPVIVGNIRHITFIGDLAMWLDEYSMNAVMPDGSPFAMTGRTACLMRKNPEGIWLWMIDNPFAATVLKS